MAVDSIFDSLGCIIVGGKGLSLGLRCCEIIVCVNRLGLIFLVVSLFLERFLEQSPINIF
jgi:hypothetical protein